MRVLFQIFNGMPRHAMVLINSTIRTSVLSGFKLNNQRSSKTRRPAQIVTPSVTMHTTVSATCHDGRIVTTLVFRKRYTFIQVNGEKFHTASLVGHLLLTRLPIIP
jgi:hypothetical protein